ncbi:MAG: SHOCT domain-containing protein [Acidimicrobiales bacterium]
MGLMMRRRRPVMRMAAGAAVAGTAYHMGKSKEQQAQVNEQAQEAYAATQQAPVPQYAPPPPAPAPAPAAPVASGTADLDHLVELHNSGALSDEEFSAAKAKLLGI